MTGSHTDQEGGNHPWSKAWRVGCQPFLIISLLVISLQVIALGPGPAMAANEARAGAGAGTETGTGTGAGAGTVDRSGKTDGRIDPWIWLRNVYKTVTYETLANGFDLLMYTFLLEGSAASSPLFMALNIATASTAYYVHEMVWDNAGLLPEPYSSWTAPVKAGTYRVVSATRNFGIGFLFSADPVAVTSFALVAAVADTIFYLTNDYVWNWLDPLGLEPDFQTTIP